MGRSEPEADAEDGAERWDDDVDAGGDDIDGDAALTEESEEAAVMAGTGGPPESAASWKKDVQSHNIRCQDGAIIPFQ